MSRLPSVRPDERIELTVTAQARRAAGKRQIAAPPRSGGCSTAFRLESLVKWQIDADLPQLLSRRDDAGALSAHAGAAAGAASRVGVGAVSNRTVTAV
jgi:hypothetical protein